MVWIRRSLKLSLRLRFDGISYFLQGLLARLASSRFVSERIGELFLVLLHIFFNFEHPWPSMYVFLVFSGFLSKERTDKLS